MLRTVVPLLCAVLMAIPAIGAARNPVAADTPFDRSVAETKAAMVADPHRALDSAQRSLALANALPDGREQRVAIATAKWLQGEAFIFLNDAVRARPIIDDALATVTADAPDTKLNGDLMRSRGALSAIGGKVQEALNDYQQAYNIFARAGEQRSQAIALKDIGEIYLDAGDYDRVLDYYAQAAELVDKDTILLLTTRNNRAEVFRKLGRHPEAVAEFKRALVLARQVNSPLLETRILTNLALAQVDAGALSGAQASIDAARRLSSTGEAYGWQNFVFGAAAKLAAARRQNPQAQALLERTFDGVDLAKTDMSYMQFHALGAQVYEANGDAKTALRHLRAFQRLDAEARNLVASTNAQLMAARFDFTNQNLKISKLKQGQLERDVAFERQRATYQAWAFGGLLVVGAVIVALLLAGFVSLRRSRNEVRAANDNLTGTNAKLEKALLAKTEFLATTSHEIRTPLNGILGMTQVLLADTEMNDGVRSKVQVVHGAGEAMRALVDDILDVAKMETGEVTLDLGDCDLHAVLGDAIDLWQGQAQVKGVALVRELGDVPRRIVTDSARLRQIVSNLMSNAVKFTLDGSVGLAARVVRVGDDERLVVTVTDTGIGIAADQHELIFEAFRQVDGGTSRRFGGTGLGLSICRRLATALGGTVTVESTPDLGSVFTLDIPLVRAGVAGPAVSAAVASTLATATLMLVERNMLKASILRAVLEPHVATLSVATTANAALTAIEHRQVTHVLIEASSTGAEAPLEALTALAQAARAADVNCSILLAPDDPLSLGDAATAGADQLIVKPIDGAGLIASLNRLYADHLPIATAA